VTETEKRILIIDTNITERTVMAAFLKSENFSVETGKGLADAVEKIRRGYFDCLIMDVKLPEMKGYEAVPIIKSIDPKIKVIMTTKKNTKSLEAKVREQDDPDFRDAVTPILESALYDVVNASNPEEGKKKIFSEKPDLILLDIMMDSLFDGFSLCHAIKTSKEYKEFNDIPIIFVSAVKEVTGSRFQFKGEEQGMVGPDDYIDKPVKPDDLLSRIEKLLNK